MKKNELDLEMIKAKAEAFDLSRELNRLRNRFEIVQKKLNELTQQIDDAEVNKGNT
jgi:uncharacterized membrane protein